LRSGYFFATGRYGDVMPRLLGVVLFALGMVIVQTTCHRLEVLYTTTLVLRVFIVLVLAGLLFTRAIRCSSRCWSWLGSAWS
jgi:hypothetical protein